MTPEGNDEIAALKNQICIMMIALIVISGTLAVYLYRQTSIAGKELVQLQPVEAKVQLNQAQQQKAVVGFINQLIAYSQKDPRFKPILTKYGITQTAPTAPAAPAKP